MKDEPKKIEMISVDKITPNKVQSAGIRNQEKFERLKENMREHGQNEPIILRRVGDKYECIIGYNRTEVAKQLGWKMIKAIVVDVDDDEAAEMCISDNICRSDYPPIQMEDMAYTLWNTNKYKSYAKLGRKIGLTGEWISNLIRAKEIRAEIEEKSQVTFDDKKITTQTIIDVKSLENIDDITGLLKLVQDGKIKNSEVKTVVKLLLSWDKDAKNAVLYKGVSYHKIKADIESEIEKQIPKDSKKITIPSDDPSLLKKLYSIVNEKLPSFIAGLDNEEVREQSLNYSKVMMALTAEMLYKEEEITEKQFESITNDLLGIKVDLHSYNGGSLVGLNEYF